MKRTFSTHASFETLLEATILALVAMVLVNGAVAITATRVRQITTNRSLEETLATLARELSVVLAGALVTAHDALDARLFGVVDCCRGRRAAGVMSTRRVSTIRVVVIGLARVVVVMVVVVSVAACRRRDGRPGEGGAGRRLEGVRRGHSGCSCQLVDHAARCLSTAPDDGVSRRRTATTSSSGHATSTVTYDQRHRCATRSRFNSSNQLSSDLINCERIDASLIDTLLYTGSV